LRVTRPAAGAGLGSSLAIGTVGAMLVADASLALVPPEQTFNGPMLDALG
jgi:hypothetical protein